MEPKRSNRWGNLLGKVIYVLAFGFTMLYYSEILFWARWRPEDSAGGMLATWLVYSFAAACFLVVVETFHARSFWAVFLAGAFFGWLIEGVIVQTTYEDLPLSISFTGLAWHSLISICGGWMLTRRGLREKPERMGLYCLGAGLFYGFWAVSWWMQEPGVIAATPQFALYSFLFTIPLAGAAWLMEKTGPEQKPFSPSGRWILPGIAAAAFLLGSAQSVPLSIVLFPALMLAVYLPLCVNRKHEAQFTYADLYSGELRIRSIWLLFLIPMGSVLVYGTARLAGILFPSHWVVYLVTTLAGFALFGLSVVNILRTNQAEQAKGRRSFTDVQ